MIHVAKLAVLLDLPFTMTLCACSLVYGEKVALEVIRIRLPKSFPIGRLFINLMTGLTTAFRVHHIDARRIQKRDVGTV